MTLFTNALHADFITVPAQTFVYGSASRSRHRRETDPRSISVDAFSCSARLVTQSEWVAVMGENPSRFAEGFEAMLRPVERVSWHDAIQFCSRLTAQLDDGGVYRLPTEYEWECIARCGASTRWHFGEQDRDLDNFGWHAGNAGARTRPVGTKEGNPLGFFDLYGNVSEWCADLAPEGTREGQRVHRGGAWLHEAESCRSGMRFFADAGKQSDSIGLRLVREVIG